MMSELSSKPWVYAVSYHERWDVIANRVGVGGQGYGHKGQRKCDQKIAFVKVFEGLTSERRARCYGEAMAYASLEGLNVPRLIESNARQHRDGAVELYIATEFIEGKNLRDWRSAAGHVSLEAAIDITLKLLDTVAQAHAAGVLHRDIKPENIIMRDGDAPCPVLVDFGIAFNHNHDLPKSITNDGNQLGNRFLNLPELYAGSADKRSPVADLTSIAGIFFYLVTKLNPTQLRDGDGNHPHQREKAKTRLVGFELSGLLRFFDRAFQARTHDRFQTPQSMRSELLKILSDRSPPEVTDVKGLLHDMLEDPIFKMRGERSSRVQEALSWAVRWYGSVREKTNGNVLAQQVFIDSGSEPGFVRIRWDLYSQYRLCTYVWVEEIGGELVWYTSLGEVYRTAIGTNLSEQSGTAFIEQAVEPDMVRVLRNEPLDLTPEFLGRHVLKDRLTHSVEDALDLSKSSNLPVYAIIYDPNQPIAHRENLLDAVFGERTAQDVILSSFVLLVAKRSLLPADLNLSEVSDFGDFSAVIEDGLWTRARHLSANREASRIRLLELQREFAGKASVLG